MKLLIVEDHPTVRQMLRHFVADLADDIQECSDGAEALAEYRATQPDWVLMDWQMPRVSGLTATERILADFPDARILIVTNHNDALMRAAAIRAGARGYVLKENLLELRERLQQPLSPNLATENTNPTHLP